eukprot:Seg4628.2 transcript_id=Seg4628.2/GoldUCD/mRNA.D3Y31 product="hypothetical protein" protein_id=Seg4628.2/GoldUCD/D3Y31
MLSLECTRKKSLETKDHCCPSVFISSNMATFACIPQEILENILLFLPLRDKINSRLVCTHWNKIVAYTLQHVTINASVPYGGRWLEENMRWVGARWQETVPQRDYNDYDSDEEDRKVWYRDENDPADKEMKNLLSKLCKITNEIKTLDIQNYQLGFGTLAELFSKQRGIQTLRIYDNLPHSVIEGYFATIVQGIIKHQETIEVIDIVIDSGHDPDIVKNFKGNFSNPLPCKERLCFPKLRSLKFWIDARSAHNDAGKDFLLTLLESNQLEEISFQDLYSPVTLSQLLKNGSLRSLKKLSLINFLTDLKQRHSVEQLIKCCPNIEQVHGFHQYIDEADYDQSMLQIMSTFGPQLKHLGCDTYYSETTKAILEKCRNLESLYLRIYPTEEELSVVKHLIPALGCLERLTRITLLFQCTNDEQVEAEIFCEFIENYGRNLTTLELEFDGTESFKILNAIGAYCKNLVYLRLMIDDRPSKDEEDPLRTSQLKGSMETVFEGCQKLTTLQLKVYKCARRFSSSEESEPIFFYHQIGKKLPRLQKLIFSHNMSEYPQSGLVKLIQELPYCKIDNIYCNCNRF